MQFQTSRFGVIDVDEDGVLNFPRGLPGFEHLRRFVLLPGGKDQLFGWLQSADNQATAFLVTDPFVFYPGYFVDIPDRDAHELMLEAPAQAVVLVIVSVPEGDIRRATANLLAPLVINTGQHLARQVILNSSPFGTRQPLFPATGQVPVAAAEGDAPCSF